MTDEEKKEYQKAYYKANKAKCKAYKQSHKEERKAYQKAYYKAHEEELKEYREAHKAEAKVYREAHRDEYNAYSEFYQRQQYCCEEISLIENYELAKKDNFVNWDVHHRLETNSDVNLSRKELKALDMYYNRPASELIFMTHSEHISLHNMKKH